MSDSSSSDEGNPKGAVNPRLISEFEARKKAENEQAKAMRDWDNESESKFWTYENKDAYNYKNPLLSHDNSDSDSESESDYTKDSDDEFTGTGGGNKALSFLFLVAVILGLGYVAQAPWGMRLGQGVFWQEEEEKAANGAPTLAEKKEAIAATSEELETPEEEAEKDPQALTDNDKKEQAKRRRLRAYRQQQQLEADKSAKNVYVAAWVMSVVAVTSWAWIPFCLCGKTFESCCNTTETGEKKNENKQGNEEEKTAEKTS